MNRLITWWANNPVAANLLMIMLLVAGGLSLMNIKREVIPSFELDQINITVAYPGATPAEVETGVIIHLEEAIADLSGIDRLTSTAREGVASIAAELSLSADSAELLEKVRSRVDALRTLPDSIEDPVIEQVDVQHKVINVAIYGDVDESSLRAYADVARDQLLSTSVISQVRYLNAADREIGITVSESALRQWNLSFDLISQQIRQHAIDLPGGSIEASGGDLLLRVQQQAYTAADFATIPLRSLPDGRQLTIGDVAFIEDGFAGSDQRSYYNGQPAVLLGVYRVNQQDVLQVAQAAHEQTKLFPSHPKIEVATFEDSSIYFQQRLDTLVSNGLGGLASINDCLSIIFTVAARFVGGAGYSGSLCRCCLVDAAV